MTNAPLNFNPSQKISAQEINLMWDKISKQEASGMKLTSDLVSQVQAKYSLSADQAQRDVNTWVNGRTF
jgi:hypothetical protein